MLGSFGQWEPCLSRGGSGRRNSRVAVEISLAFSSYLQAMKAIRLLFPTLNFPYSIPVSEQPALCIERAYYLQILQPPLEWRVKRLTLIPPRDRAGGSSEGWLAAMMSIYKNWHTRICIDLCLSEIYPTQSPVVPQSRILSEMDVWSDSRDGQSYNRLYEKGLTNAKLMSQRRPDSRNLSVSVAYDTSVLRVRSRWFLTRLYHKHQTSSDAME